jgi:heme exporter protein A
LNTSLRIFVSDLACSRGERRLFQGLGFMLDSGEAMVVTGPNGVGKTTLLRALAGFVRPDKGSIKLEGTTEDIPMAEASHFVGHRDGLKGALTVRENLELAPALLGSRGIAAGEAAARLNLMPLLDLPVAVLSAGQRRRAALARLLVAERPIWLLDEPTAALDAASSVLVETMLRDHASSGGIVIATTHLPLHLSADELAFGPDGSFALKEGAS